MHEIVPTTIEHINYISSHLKEDEKREVFRMGHPDPHHLLRYSFVISSVCYTWVYNHIPLLVAGIGKYSVFDDFSTIWLASTPHASNHKTTLIRNSKRMLALLNNDNKILGTHIDGELKSTLKWVKLLGFTVDEGEPISPYNHIFHFCHKEA